MSQPPPWPNQRPPAPPIPPPYPPQQPPTWQQAPVQPTPVVAWYHQKWFVVLMLLLFLPVGVALLWRSPLTKPQGRMVWTVIASLLFIALVQRTPAPPPAASPVASATETTQKTPPASAPAVTPAAAPATAAPASPPAAQPAPAPKAAPTWQAVKSWKGSGIKETESFTTTSREWRISWKSSNERVAGLLQIMVNDENGGLVSMAANAQGTGSDTSYVRGKPGRYYLKINSANVDWEVTVEEQR